MHTWQLQEAKNKLSQVVDEALANGPQVITRHGQEVVIVLALDEYRRLAAADQSLVTFFRESPLVYAELDFGRDQSAIRDEFLAAPDTP